MTAYTLKTSEKEAADIYTGRQMFVIRSDRYDYKIGDRINFLCMKNGRPVTNKISEIAFEVSALPKAPLAEGFKIIGFRRLAKGKCYE